MKWDEEFVKKLYLIDKLGKKGVFYDEKRIEPNFFNFLEQASNGKEDTILKDLR
jgi:hypothetical protein